MRFSFHDCGRFIDFSEKWYLITRKEQSFDLSDQKTGLKKLPLSILNYLWTRDIFGSGLLTVFAMVRQASGVICGGEVVEGEGRGCIKYK